MNNISLNIKRLVDEKFDGNVSRFAAKVGISETNVRNYIAGRVPKFEILEQIVESFELSYDDFIAGIISGAVKKPTPYQHEDSSILLNESTACYNQGSKLEDSISRLILQLEKKDNIIDQLNKDIRALLEDNTELREKLAGLIADNQRLKEVCAALDASIGHSAAG